MKYCDKRIYIGLQYYTDFRIIGRGLIVWSRFFKEETRLDCNLKVFSNIIFEGDTKKKG